MNILWFFICTSFPLFSPGIASALSLACDTYSLPTLTSTVPHLKIPSDEDIQIAEEILTPTP